MNRWLQSKIYECPQCQASYRHDEAYFHALFACLNRGGSRKESAAVPRHTGVPAPAVVTNL